MWRILKTRARSGQTSAHMPLAGRARLGVEALEDRLVPATLLSSAALTPLPVARVSPAVVTQFNPAVAWIDQNINDPGLRTLLRQLDADRTLSRDDMLAVLLQVRADGSVSGTEFGDLQDMVAKAATLGMPDDVRVLSGKVVNGDPANAHYRGNPLGDLKPGSSGYQLIGLENKWFRGQDWPALPDADLRYRPVPGPLFVDGPSPEDVNQGELGDCWYMAVLSETARQSPASILNTFNGTGDMFNDNGDGTFTVRFYRNSTADYVTVDRYLPADKDTNELVFANQHTPCTAVQELWVALAEKAYAQLNESGWIGRDDTNTYAGLEWGSPTRPLEHVTGRPATSFPLQFSATAVATMVPAVGHDFNAGHLVVFCSRDGGVAANVVANHCYAAVGYDAATGTFTLSNPWNGNEITQTTFQLFGNFSHFAVTDPSAAVLSAFWATTGSPSGSAAVSPPPGPAALRTPGRAAPTPAAIDLHFGTVPAAAGGTDAAPSPSFAAGTGALTAGLAIADAFHRRAVDQAGPSAEAAPKAGKGVPADWTSVWGNLIDLNLVPAAG